MSKMTWGRSLRPVGLTLTVAVAATALAACGSGNANSPNGSQGSNSPGASGAFKVDTSKCLDLSAATNKVTKTWKIGFSLAMSGPTAGIFADVRKGVDARFEAQNKAGGIEGVKIDASYADDALDPAKAKANATKFIESDKVNSIWVSAQNLADAVVEEQNLWCVPLLYSGESSDAHHDIAKYPWTIPALPTGSSEAAFDVNLIQAKFPNGTSVGVVADPARKANLEALKTAAQGTDVTIAAVADSSDMNSAAAQLASKKVDVVVMYTLTPDCGALLTALSRIGYAPRLAVAGSNCTDPTAFVAAGGAAEGTILPAYLKQSSIPGTTDDEGFKKYLADMNAAGYSSAEVLNGGQALIGWWIADLTVNTLLQAAKSPDGLTQLSVIQAARDQKYASPVLFNGIDWLSTPEEMTGVSALQPLVWKVAEKAFLPDGAPVPVSK